jgi:hypothetical protein
VPVLRSWLIPSFLGGRLAATRIEVQRCHAFSDPSRGCPANVLLLQSQLKLSDPCENRKHQMRECCDP